VWGSFDKIIPSVAKPAYFAFDVKPDNNCKHKRNKLKPRMMNKPMFNPELNTNFFLGHLQ